jgi:hypothetical protein
MGIFDWLSAPSKGKPYFLFGDGSKKTSNELGKLFVIFALSQAELLLQGLTSNSKIGNKLPLALSVSSNVVPAKLYLIALIVASYMTHPIKSLGVPAEVIREILDGIAEELKSIKKPNGSLIHSTDIERTNQLIGGFFDFVVSDIESSFDNPEIENSISENSKPPKTTQLLISLIVAEYNGGGLAGKNAVEKLEEDGYYCSQYADTTKFINLVPKAATQTLDKFNISYQSLLA